MRWWQRKRLERELDRELLDHLEFEASEQRDAGQPPGEAWYAARRALGNTALVKETVREAWGWTFLDGFSQDLRYALRTLRWNPGFAAVAVLALALGVGANAAIYSILDAVYLRLLPVEKPERLVVFTTQFTLAKELRYNQSFSYPLYREVRDRTQSLEGAIAYRSLIMNAGINGSTERITGAMVSGNYFSVLGVQPVAGTLVGPEDDLKPGSGGARGPVAVLSYAYWNRRFGGDAGVIGTRIDLNGAPFTIVGVARDGFSGTEVGQAPDVFGPMMMESLLNPTNPNGLDAPRNVWLRIMGRLKQATRVPQAEAELSLLLQRFYQRYYLQGSDVPPARRRALMEQRVTLLPGSTGTSGLRKKFSQPLTILMAVAGFVLLIACANVASLLLTRAAGRQREIAIRLALGATRGRLVCQLLVESMILAMAGSTLGLLISRWVRDLILRFLPQAADVSVALDQQVFGFCLLLGVATGLLFGLVPALQATRPSVAPALKGVGHSGLGPARLNLRQGLVVLQVALSVLLLTGAGLFVRSLGNLESIDPGFARQNVLLLAVDPSLKSYPPAQAKAFYERLLAHAKTLPGVIRAAMADSSPLGNNTNNTTYVEGYQPRSDEPALDPNVSVITPEYFQTMGVRLLMGREFDARDTATAPQVAVINETFARHYFPGQNPLGRRLGFNKDRYDVEIVGVVKDAKYGNLREASTRMLYGPLTQRRLWGHMVLHLRTAGEVAPLVAAVRSYVRELDKDLPVFDVQTVQQEVDRSLNQDKLIATLSGMFSILALVLSAIGLYGVMSYAVSRRVREIGIRMALGAEAGKIVGLVLKEAALLVTAGVLVGLPAAYAAARIVSGLLYGVNPADPASALLATAALGLVAMAAAWIPARRAARVSPTVALRCE
ncbi:MAG TPA: ABC transporter permease [Candidatus Acidoferrales bacterium]|jgi:predicted permease|nr:ABC transporter permease [Candidatus Acidoferrales bacterium]